MINLIYILIYISTISIWINQIATFGPTKTSNQLVAALAHETGRNRDFLTVFKTVKIRCTLWSPNSTVEQKIKKKKGDPSRWQDELSRRHCNSDECVDDANFDDCFLRLIFGSNERTGKGTFFGCSMVHGT